MVILKISIDAKLDHLGFTLVSMFNQVSSISCSGSCFTSSGQSILVEGSGFASGLFQLHLLGSILSDTFISILFASF